MYADAITIYSANFDLGLAEASFQNGVESVQAWFKNNKLLLNPKKSHVMLTGTRQHHREKLQHITVNGTTLDHKIMLNFLVFTLTLNSHGLLILKSLPVSLIGAYLFSTDLHT